jgi:hypothetical protein
VSSVAPMVGACFKNRPDLPLWATTATARPRRRGHVSRLGIVSTSNTGTPPEALLNFVLQPVQDKKRTQKSGTGEIGFRGLIELCNNALFSC